MNWVNSSCLVRSRQLWLIKSYLSLLPTQSIATETAMHWCRFFLYLRVKYQGNIFIAHTEVAQLAKVHFLSSEVLEHQLPLNDEKYFWQLWIVKTSYTSHTFKSVGFLLPGLYWQTQLAMNGGLCISCIQLDKKYQTSTRHPHVCQERGKLSISPHLKKIIRICGWMLPSAQVCWQAIQVQISSACAPASVHQTSASDSRKYVGSTKRCQYPMELFWHVQSLMTSNILILNNNKWEQTIGIPVVLAKN